MEDVFSFFLFMKNVINQKKTLPLQHYLSVSYKENDKKRYLWKRITPFNKQIPYRLSMGQTTAKRILNTG